MENSPLYLLLLLHQTLKYDATVFVYFLVTNTI